MRLVFPIGLIFVSSALAQYTAQQAASGRTIYRGNCAICHVGTWRATESDLPHVVIGSPANTSNVQSMLRFLVNCAADPRFNADTLLAQIERETKLSISLRN